MDSKSIVKSISLILFTNISPALIIQDRGGLRMNIFRMLRKRQGLTQTERLGAENIKIDTKKKAGA